MLNIPLPQDLPLLMGRSSSLDAVISKIHSVGHPDTITILNHMKELTSHVKIKVGFNKPTLVHRTRYKGTEVTEAVIGKVFQSKNGWGFTTRHKRVRTGLWLDWADSIAYYEPVTEPERKHEGFKSLKAFTRKFDPRFITPEEIEKLYTGKSCQTGAAYTPGDFHQLGPQGKRVLERFLRGFKSLSEEGLCYRDGYTKGTRHYDESYRSYHHKGRDISISHTLGQPYIHYSSEFHGCGNGRYGLLANESTFLHLEDD